MLVSLGVLLLVNADVAISGSDATLALTEFGLFSHCWGELGPPAPYLAPI